MDIAEMVTVEDICEETPCNECELYSGNGCVVKEEDNERRKL